MEAQGDYRPSRQLDVAVVMPTAYPASIGGAESLQPVQGLFDLLPL
jgi:hypothetical protein